jgi:hypothetical protein
MRKVAISFFMSLCLSVRMEKHGSHLMDFHKILHLSIFRKPVQNFQFSLQYDKNNRYFTCEGKYIYDNISLDYS